MEQTNNSNKTPSLFLAGDINEDTLIRVIPFLFNNRKRAVNVFLCSNGGDTRCGLEIMKFFEAHGKVTCIASGYCNSIATIIMLGAKKKMATRDTEFLIHFGMSKVSSIQEDNIARELNERTIKIYMEKLKITKEQMDLYMLADVYFYFERALEMGLIDAEYKL